MIKTILKFFGRFCVGLLMLAISLSFSYSAQSPGSDYTKEYNIYQDIYDITNISDITQYLDNNDISYTISKQKLKLNDYDNISYILDDNNSCKIIHSKLIYRLSKLDEKDYDIVSVDKFKFNDELTERIYLKKGIYTYSKINDKYFINDTIIQQTGYIISAIATMLTFMNLTIDIMYEISNQIKKKRENKKTKFKSLTTDIKNDSNHS